MLFNPVSCLALMAIANAATISKISDIVHDIDVNRNKLEIRAVTQNTPHKQDILIFETFETTPNARFKIRHPITFETDESNIKLDSTITVNSAEIDNEYLVNINSEYDQKPEDCEIKVDNNEINDIQTEDPFQNIEYFEDILKTTEANVSKIDFEIFNDGNGDEKEYVIVNGISNDSSSGDSNLDATEIRRKRSANVIKEENQSTTVSEHKLYWSGRYSTLTYNMLFKNINS